METLTFHSAWRTANAVSMDARDDGVTGTDRRLGGVAEKWTWL